MGQVVTNFGECLCRGGIAFSFTSIDGEPVNVQGENGRSLGGKVLSMRCEFSEFGDTGEAPGCPEIDEEWFANEVSCSSRVALGVGAG